MTREEAIKELRGFIGQLTEGCQEAIKVLIPELKEGEDEIHRKWILEYLYEGLRESDEQFKEQFKSAIDWLEKQKVQKPVEYLPKEKVYDIMSKLTDLSYSKLIPFKSRESQKIDEITSDVRDLLDYPIEKKQEQKPAEWGEEDEDKLIGILEMIKYTDALPPTDIPSCTGHLHLSNEYKEKLSSWLKNRLKSLCPQPHSVTIKDATKFGNLEYERGVKDGIQNEKSRHWKPSEEQMGALNDAWMECEYKDRAEALNSLYNDLKKL